MRILVAGVPRAGKTLFAESFCPDGGSVWHTDDLIGEFDWSALSLEVSKWIDQPGDWTIEGMAVPRALRKWLARNPEGKPCDVIYWIGNTKETLTKGQSAMAKGTLSVWNEIREKLIKRGVQIIDQ